MSDPRETCDRCAAVRVYFRDGVCNDHLPLRTVERRGMTIDGLRNVIIRTEPDYWLRYAGRLDWVVNAIWDRLRVSAVPYVRLRCPSWPVYLLAPSIAEVPGMRLACH